MDGFSGYRREDGTLGMRNLIAVIPTVFCNNDVVDRIARDVEGAVPLMHMRGCCELPFDHRGVEETLIGLGRNPNVGAVLVVGLGCEGVSAEEVRDGIAASGKPVEMLGVQEVGGTLKAIAHGIKAVREMARDISSQSRAAAGLDELVIAPHCGGSDATSGISANPVVGLVSDRLIDAGGTVIMSETPELIGGETHLLKRAVNDSVRNDILRIIEEMEDRVMACGVDMRGGQPTPGNIAGGITTIEEKTLGGILKSGSTEIKGVLKYSEKPGSHGLYLMDSPAKSATTGVMAAGAQLEIFTTGKGSPVGAAIIPVIKVTGNSDTYLKLKDDMDFSAGSVISGEESLEEAADRLWEMLLDVASGRMTKSEALGYSRIIQIHMRGPEL